MKRLASLPLPPEQEREILRLLDEAGIAHRETRAKSRLFGADAIWVSEQDYLRAREIVDKEAADYAAEARAQWQAEWRSEHGGSYPRWLRNRLRRTTPEELVRALVLIVLVSVMLLYPLALVL
jgi:hypothetical protein